MDGCGHVPGGLAAAGQRAAARADHRAGHSADLVFDRARGGHQPAAAGGDRLHHRCADFVLRPDRYRLHRCAAGRHRAASDHPAPQIQTVRCAATGGANPGCRHCHRDPDIPRPDPGRRGPSQRPQARCRAQPEVVRRAHPLRAAVHGQPGRVGGPPFAVLALLVALAVAVAMSLRKGRIPGTAAGPSRRIIGITVISFLAMMFTPTKWTHHFGVFAGLAGSLGALAAVAVTGAAMQSRRNRTMFAALVLFVLALSFASVNGWWYVSNFGVPWSNSFPKLRWSLTTALLELTVVVLLVAAWFHFVATDDKPPKTRYGARVAGIIQSPLAIAAWVLVIFEVVSLTLAMTGQYPAWSVGRSNLQALAGLKTGYACGLAEDVLVEQDPNAGMLPPVTAPVQDALGAGLSEAFTPNGIPSDVSADPVMERPGDRSFVNDNATITVGEAGNEGGTSAAPGINGSKAQLPYNLDPSRTPVLGSWRSGIQVPARLRSGWYRLPGQRDKAGPLVVVTAAGRFDSREVQVQWATDEGAASGHPGGSLQFADVGASPAWRNLRLPMSAIPANATQLRLIADDQDLAPQHWIGLTPPRIPELRTLQAVVGSQAPVFLDWLVGLAFPCQRPFGHQNGVDETPRWRILPDRFGAEANSPVMDNNGGGPLGVTELLVQATTVATYLKDDWSRDWGSLQRLTPYYPNAQPARLQLGTQTRSGLWNPAPLRK